MFKQIDFKFDLFANPFDNLKYRDRTTLILSRDGNGKLLLGASDQYPSGIVRMIGGGVDKEEDVLMAAIREVKEETGADITSEELVELVAINLEGTFSEANYKHTISVYFLNSTKDNLLAGDDVSEIVAMTEDEYRGLVANMRSLKADHMSSTEESAYSWGDFGKVYGFVHEVALDEALSKGL